MTIPTVYHVLSNILATRLILLSIASLYLSSSSCNAEQFVLFDVTFDYTKEDADNSKPSKSHFYVGSSGVSGRSVWLIGFQVF